MTPDLGRDLLLLGIGGITLSTIDSLICQWRARLRGGRR